MGHPFCEHWQRHATDDHLRDVLRHICGSVRCSAAVFWRLTVHAAETEVSTSDVLTMALIVILLQCIQLGLLFVLGNRLGFPPGDVVCLMFCASHKSLTLGRQWC